MRLFDGKKTMRKRRIVSLLVAVLVASGCVRSTLAVRPLSYDVDVQLEPVAHTLEAEVSIEFESLEPGPGAKRNTLELLLHPDLDVSSVEVRGATLRAHKKRKGRSDDDSAITPVRHQLIVEASERAAGRHARVSRVAVPERRLR